MRRQLLLLVGVCSALMLTTAASVAPSAVGAGTAQNYMILYKSESVPATAAKTIQRAGGTLVYAYGQIGVAIASSSDALFQSNLLKADKSIEGAVATAAFATRLENTQAEGPPPGDLPNAPATDADALSSLQWDMRQIHAPEAHAITGGSPTVLVGDIDTGIDFTHPDLAANIDVANSVNCVSGAPVPGLAAQDDNGHGTHTAGTIAAASNGIGIVGVAPNVRIAGIKAANADGYFFPEAVICSFYWAGTHGIDITNNSYFADPYLFNCKNDPVQRAIWKAEQRAIRFAQQNGVLVVASEGNNSEDLSHPTTDATSPDFPPGANVTRPVTNACVVIPVELPGVVGVSATGSYLQGTDAGDYPDNLKSFYSSYGVSTVDVAAPGGDSRFGTPPFNTPVTGRVLSTWPTALMGTCPRPEVDPGFPTATYCWHQGTSMASPHAAGVAALIVSRYGSLAGPGNATMQPGKVSAILQGTADPQACPETLPTTPSNYAAVVGTESGAPQTCQGGPGHNSWYGAGQVDALNAVTHNT
jgi:subtilisin family serine protease